MKDKFFQLLNRSKLSTPQVSLIEDISSLSILTLLAFLSLSIISVHFPEIYERQSCPNSITRI